jgi:hypothetical protein
VATPQWQIKVRDVNFCTSCGMDFGSVVAFDAHRVGKHAYEYSPEHPDGRRCLTPKEMSEKKFKLNRRGAWSTSTLTRGLEAEQSDGNAHQ